MIEFNLAHELRNQANEIASEGHVGWGNLDLMAADEIERLRAELAKWKATTPAPKPDCRTCAHVYTDMESYGCKRSTTGIVCIKGDGYAPSLPVRLYETGRE